MPSSALELSTASKLGNSSPTSFKDYVQNLGSLFSAKGFDAVTGATLTQDEMPHGYSHINPADSAAAFRAGKPVSEFSNSGYDTNSASGYYPSTPQQLQYIDAPYAEMYGMDISTAYQEALANTSYRRKVADLKAAGLNPVLGYSGSGAASFYGTPDAGVSSSGGLSYGSSGSAKTTSFLSSKQKDTLLINLPKAIGGIVSVVKGPVAGAATTAIGNAVSNIIRYW